MAKIADDERAYLNVLRVVIISFLKGTAPILAVEAARRATPNHVRPSFKELEEACRGHGSAAPATPAADAPATPPEDAQAAATGG
jgi:chemotaxis protein MotA